MIAWSAISRTKKALGMDRRNFFKLAGTVSGGAITGACGKQGEQIIPLLVREEEIVPGREEWHQSICGECSAACGTEARVMAAEREIDVEGERFRQPIAAIKKLDGNPLDPVSGGRLCARGHSSLQSIYNPDRIRGPLKRVGERGEGRFETIGWDEALAEVASALARSASEKPDRILFLARPLASTRSENIARFLDALGAPPATTGGTADFAAERQAAKRAFGWDGLPVYEIQDSTLVLSIGADFLGGWISPVLYTRRYGHMRRGREELRGRLIHAESRFSLTAGNANRWLPVWPGGELALALGIGHCLVSDGGRAGLADLPEEALSAFATVDLAWAAEASGIPAETMLETALALSKASAPLVIAGASMVRENSADAVTAACALNLLLGSVGRKGGVLPPAPSGTGLERSRPSLEGWERRLAEAEILLVDGVNPAYNSPDTKTLLDRIGTVVSFSPFLDDTAAFADLILPDHDPLERGWAAVPDVSPVPTVSATERFVAPLHDTRATDDVLTSLAAAIERPFESTDAESVLSGLHEQAGSPQPGPAGFARQQLREGGWRGTRDPTEQAHPAGIGGLQGSSRSEGPLFQAYASLQFGEGGTANRPWMQELPDPTSSAMWGTPVELDPGTAARLDVTNGAMVVVESDQGSLVAPVYVNPAAIPGVASMALGHGHRHFGRYASGRGANPAVVLGAVRDKATGAVSHGPVAVRIVKSEATGRLIQFSQQDRDDPAGRG